MRGRGRGAISHRGGSHTAKAGKVRVDFSCSQHAPPVNAITRPRMPPGKVEKGVEITPVVFPQTGVFFVEFLVLKHRPKQARPPQGKCKCLSLAQQLT
jgi:hypothetical protein